MGEVRQMMRKPEVKDLIEKRDWTKLRSLVSRWAVADVADLLAELDVSDRVVFYRSLPRPLATEVFAFLEPDEQDALLRDLTTTRRATSWKASRPTTARPFSKSCPRR